MQKYVFDTETYPNYFLCVAKNAETKEIIGFEFSEFKNELAELRDFIYTKNIELFGFNNFDYDDRLIQFLEYFNYQASNLDIYNYSKFLITGEIEPVFKAKLADFQKIKWHKTTYKSLDLMKLQPGRLKTIGVSLGHPKLQELPYDPNKPLNKDEINSVFQYCLNDVEITEKLYFACQPKLEAREFLNEELESIKKRVNYTHDFRKFGDLRLGADYMAIKYTDKNNLDYKMVKELKNPDYNEVELTEIISPKIKFETPTLQEFLKDLKTKKLTFDKTVTENITALKPNNLKEIETNLDIFGSSYTFATRGLHSNNSNQVFKSTPSKELIYADVTSFYPNIVINERIVPPRLNDSWIEIYQELVNERKIAKNAGEITKSEALKIIINSLYGILNNKFYYTYDPKSLYKVTINGQLYLLMLIEKLEINGFKVIYANTDGLVYLKNKGGQNG